MGDLAASTVFGMSGSGNWADPELRPLNYRELAFKLFPDSPSPFTKILSKLPSSTTDDPYYHIFEWRLPKMAFITTAVDAVVTTIPLNNAGDEPIDPAQGLKEGDLLKNEFTGEIVLVTDPPTNPWVNIEVQRHWGGTAPATGMLADQVLRWVGSAYEEGTKAPGAVSRRASVVLNYTQIFKDTADVTGTAEQMRTRPMKPWPQLKGEALERHMIKMEYAFLHGIQNAETGPGGKEIRTTGGFREQIAAAQGLVDMSGMDIDLLENNMQTAFHYGSSTKIGLIGYTGLNYINKLVRENTQFQFNAPLPKEQTYGLNVTELRSPFGSLMLIPHPLMAESALYTEELYIIDPKYVEYVSMRSRDTKWKDNAQDNDEDTRKGYYQTECGMRLALPEVHAVWTLLGTP